MNDTKLSLILAAERLIAQQGVDNVSGAMIIEAADQSNASAINYHFGNKDKLIRAALKMRMTKINDSRKSYIRDINSDSNTLDIINCIILPIEEEIIISNGKCFYCRFINEIMKKNNYYKNYIDSGTLSPFYDISRIIIIKLGGMSQKRKNFFTHFLSHNFLFGMAYIEEMHDPLNISATRDISQDFANSLNRAIFPDLI